MSNPFPDVIAVTEKRDRFSFSLGQSLRWRSTVRLYIVLSVVAALATNLPFPAASADPQAFSEKVDHVLILKAERRLYLMSGARIVESYPVALGRNSRGPKRARNDGKTPEGLYYIDGRNAHSPFHRSLHLSYPNGLDIKRAQSTGVAPGGDIAIHGMPNRYGPFDPIAFYTDWTDGCIAVGNRAIEDIWNRVAIGTAVEIRP